MRAFAFNRPGEILENCLPSSALHFDRVGFFSIERHPHGYAIIRWRKFDLCGAVAEGILNSLVLDDFRVGSGEIKTHAASLASIREENSPPTRKSTLEVVVCHSSDAAFHC